MNIKRLNIKGTIKSLIYQFHIALYILHQKKETPEGVSFVLITIKLEFVVKVCTVEVSFVVASLIFPVEAVVCGQAYVVL